MWYFFYTDVTRISIVIMMEKFSLLMPTPVCLQSRYCDRTAQKNIFQFLRRDAEENLNFMDINSRSKRFQLVDNYRKAAYIRKMWGPLKSPGLNVVG